MDEAPYIWAEAPWEFADAREKLDRLLDLAARQEPQRIRRGDREAVVLDVDAYAALKAAADQALPPPPVQRDVCTCSGRTFLNALRDSPWRDALEGGDWPWAWNSLTREWDSLPPLASLRDAMRPDGAAVMAGSFLDAMQKSPLAQAIRDAGISDDELDQLFGIRG